MRNIINKEKASSDLASRLEPPPLFYDKVRHSFWALEKGGGWTSLGEGAAVDILRLAGFLNTTKGDDLSQVASELVRVRFECGVEYAGPLSGYRKGLYDRSGKKLLVTRSYNLIRPQPGRWPVIATFLRGLLGREQTLIFLFWLKLAYEALADESNRRPGQAVIFAGPRDGGKSFLQNHIITQVLGGRECRCYRYLSGHTEFNGDLFEAEHLMVDDDVPTTKYAERMALGTRIKGIVASEPQSCHFKYRDAFTVTPFWRPTVSVNDSPESLLVLPPIEDSLEDKVILFKTQTVPLPMPTVTQEERSAFRLKIQSEIPALLYRITHAKIPASYAERRFGIAHYHHPEIIQAVRELSPEEKLLTIIDSVLFTGSLPIDCGELDEAGTAQPWSGTAGELERKLQESPYRREAEQVLYWPNACGTYLGHLARHHPERVISRRSNTARWWTIDPPVSPETGGQPVSTNPGT